MKRPNFKNLLSKVKHFSIKRYIPHTVGGIWFAILLVFTLLTVLAFVWSILLFFRLSSERTDIFIPEAADAETINRTQLEELLETLQARSATFERLTAVILEPLVVEEEDPEDEEFELDEDFLE